jgi:3-hydroxyacyl-CoA dehydrogenase/enoyl-CoA hydratase/3-hydroxybutyryl-CoA epimerase
MTTKSPPPESDTTHALRREVRDGIVLVTIDLPGRPVNVLSQGVIDELSELLDWLENGQVGLRGVVIASGKAGSWIAGADVEQLAATESVAEASDMSRMAHRLLGRLERLKLPVVAAIDGVALGGGVELALACAYRIASDAPKTKLGLPEVQLGLLPGAGGSQRLPRLIGLRQSLDFMLTGKQVDAKRALKAGLVDEVVPAAILVDRARRVVSDIASGKLTPRAGRPKGSPDWKENLPGLRSVIFRKARQGVLDKTHGLYPAPLKILQVVEAGLDLPLEQALAIEAAGFGELAATPESKSLIHVFFASTSAKNDPQLPEAAEPSEIDRVGIVGAGFMGAGIAAVTAESGMRVRLKDTTAEAVARGLQTTRKSIVERAQRRRLREHDQTQILDRLEATHEYTGFGGVDLVIEAVFEKLEVKHQVIREIEAAVRPDAIVASNTSTIPITRLAEASERPERLIGLHFFSPVEKMPLVEIIVTDATDPAVAASCHGYAKRIGKTPIIVNDAPGFYVNRILGPYMNEAAILLEEGVRIEAIDAAMVAWGFPVGPLTLYDEVGLEVAASSGRILAEEFGDRMTPSPVLERMLADGRKGRKNGRGFYLYQDGEKKGPDPSVYELVGAAPERSLAQGDIQERLSLGMMNEAVRTLEDGVLRSARDGDVGAVFGIGFPPFRGGPFWYLERAGPGAVVERLRALAAAHGSRFSPAPRLVTVAETGGTLE